MVATVGLRGTCIPLMQSVVEMIKLRTQDDGRNVEEEEEER